MSVIDFKAKCQVSEYNEQSISDTKTMLSLVIKLRRKVSGRIFSVAIDAEGK